MQIRSHRQAEYGIRREKLSQGPSRGVFHQLDRFLVAKSRKKGLVVDPATSPTALAPSRHAVVGAHRLGAPSGAGRRRGCTLPVRRLGRLREGAEPRWRKGPHAAHTAPHWALARRRSRGGERGAGLGYNEGRGPRGVHQWHPGGDTTSAAPLAPIMTMIVRTVDT